MPLTPDQLLDDITELKQRLIAKDAELLTRSSELAIKVSELAAAKTMEPALAEMYFRVFEHAE